MIANMATLQTIKGLRAEEFAVNYLQERGYRIISRNYYCSYGEIDIIAEKDEYIVFVEVKSRYQNLHATFSSVSLRKRLKIIRTASDYLLKHVKYQQNCMRFDVVGVIYNEDKHLYRIKLLEDAFRVDELADLL